MALQRAWRGIKGLFGFVERKFCVADLSDLSDRQRGKVRAAQMAAIYKMTPTSIFLNLFNMLLIAVTLGPHVPTRLMTLWVGATLLVISMVFLIWRRSRNRYPHVAPRSASVVIGLFGALRAAIWAVGLLLFFPIVGASHQLIIGLAAIGMMAGGAFGLSTVPPAATAWLTIIASSSIVTLNITGSWELNALSILMVGFYVFLIRQVRLHGRLFIDHWRSKVVADEQRETIAMLLNEFEENSSDWLWQTDGTGKFVNVSARFSEATGISVSRLEFMKYEQLFGNKAEPQNTYLCNALAERRAIHDITVAVELVSGQRHWSLTAHPIHDEEGHFTGYRGVAADITDKLRNAQRLQNLAHYDQLSGLPNRARFTELASEALHSCPIEDIGLMIIDFNGFKSINDTLGHPVGDGLLQQIGYRLREWAEDQVTVARLGGDEFAVLITDNAPRRAEGLAASLIEIIEEPFDVPPHNLAINACVGIALGGPEIGDIGALLKHADLALYAAKSKGGSQYSFFEKNMAAEMLRRQQLEHGLRQAIRDDELSLRFQPIVDVWTGRVKTFEALVRWHSPEFGDVSPDEFIPIAEESGMIVEIGEWVLARAVEEAANWPADVHVAVNISPAQLRDNRLLAFLVQRLDKSKLLPSRLEIEITEGVFLESSEHIDHTLHSLLDLGVKIALDDFGTGYSSLSYLRSFPFAKVKIDKSFIEGMAENETNVSIVKAIIDMASSLGFEVVAEGVETPAEFAVLTRLGCDYVQGYLFSAPQRATALEDMTGDSMFREAARVN